MAIQNEVELTKCKVKIIQNCKFKISQLVKLGILIFHDFRTIADFARYILVPITTSYPYKLRTILSENKAIFIISCQLKSSENAKLLCSLNDGKPCTTRP